ncbi:hypothetical protein OROGR_008275 [Orobanche gracilis]
MGFARAWDCGILILTKKLKRAVKGDFGAFIERLQLLPPPLPAPLKAPHPLTGLSFAVSDVFNIEGFVTGFGNPDWSRTHEAATHTCPVVEALVQGGATCVGKTVVDEMALIDEDYGSRGGERILLELQLMKMIPAEGIQDDSRLILTAPFKKLSRNHEGTTHSSIYIRL